MRGTCSTLCAATLSHSARTRHVHMLPQPGGKRIVQRACQHWSHQLDLMLWFRGGRGGGGRRHTIVVLLLSGPSSNAAGKAVSERVETEREGERGRVTERECTLKNVLAAQQFFLCFFFFEVNSMHVLVHKHKGGRERGAGREGRQRWRVECWGPVLAKIYQEPKYVTANRVNHKNYDECLLVNLNWQLWTAAGTTEGSQARGEGGSR